MSGYQNSKMNAQKWGTSVEGPITCRANCPYSRYFEGICCGNDLRNIGEPCTVELTYGDSYATSMSREYPLLAKYRPSEFQPLVDEAVRIALLRERLSCRSNRAWELPAQQMYDELDLTYRYWVAMHRRHLKVMERIEHLLDDVRAELEERHWRRKALSCIGAADVPEPYRSWAKQVMADYRRATSEPKAGEAP